MKCIICRDMIRETNKYEMCSNCQGKSLSTMIKYKKITIGALKRALNIDIVKEAVPRSD